MKRFSDFAKPSKIMNGEKIRMAKIEGEEIIIKGFTLGESKYEGKELLTLQIEFNGDDRVVFTSTVALIDQCKRHEDEVPFRTIIEKIDNKFYTFT